MPSSGQLGALAQPVAVAPDVEEVRVVDEPVDERPGHHVVAEYLAHSSNPLLLVRVVEACSERRVRSWKKSMALVREIRR